MCGGQDTCPFAPMCARPLQHRNMESCCHHSWIRLLRTPSFEDTAAGCGQKQEMIPTGTGAGINMCTCSLARPALLTGGSRLYVSSPVASASPPAGAAGEVPLTSFKRGSKRQALLQSSQEIRALDFILRTPCQPLTTCTQAHVLHSSRTLQHLAKVAASATGVPLVWARTSCARVVRSRPLDGPRLWDS